MVPADPRPRVVPRSPTEGSSASAAVSEIRTRFLLFEDAHRLCRRTLGWGLRGAFASHVSVPYTRPMSARGVSALGLPLWLVLPILFSGCFATHARDWFNSHSAGAIPEMSIEGYWTSSDWGEAHLSQRGHNVTGSLGGYSVQGVVNKKTAYLVLPSIYYPRFTVVLWYDKSGLLVGNWLRGAIVAGPGHGYPIILRRLRE